MKTKVRRISKRTLAMVLGILMLATCLVVGDMSIANAWSTGDNGRVHISFDNGSNWEDKYINSSGYADFEISQDCSNVKFKCVAEGTWYGYKAGSPSNGDGAYNTPYYASSSGGDISISLKAGKYVIKYVTRYDNNATLEFNLYRKKAQIDYGWNSGSWSNLEMTYNGDGAYKYTFAGDGRQLRFRPKYVDGSSTDNYRPYGTGSVHAINIKSGSFYSYGTKYNMATSDSDGNADNYFYIDTVTGGSYTIWIKDAGVWLTYTEPESYYLTGWLNGAEETGTTHAFTNTSGTTWTYTFNPTSDQGGYQYFTIKKNDGTAYHPATHGADSGTAGTNTDTSPGGDNKWKAAAVSGQTVTLTWDSSTHVLSWTVTGGGGGSSSGWKYAADGSAATPEKTGSSSYYYVWAGSDDGPGKSGTTAISTKSGTNCYWAEITSQSKANANFYFALSNNTSNSGIRGNKQEQINGTTKSAGQSVTMTNSIFVVEMKERSTVSGSAYFQLVRGVDWSKISAIGVLAEYSGSGKVNYKYYYKEKGSGGETASKVNVYAKDGAAPINWDNKGSGGASSTSGTAYNYAAIATTAISQIDGAAPASGVVTTVNCGDSSSQYQTAEVDVGKRIKITTTIQNTNSWRTKYYVAGWNINGVTYKCDGTPGVNTASQTSSGVCSLDSYTIPSDIKDDYLEITPIYYLRDNSNCITFYLEGYNDIQDKWGNTPYIYPFYGNLNNVANSFGVYPGQPMVYADGKYSTEIPLKDTPIKGSSTNTAIKGITINNGYADHVHRNMIYHWTDHDNDADHKQTYDYDDFYKIYNECLKNGSERPNSIIFRIQDETKTYNRNTYGGSKSGARVVANKSTLSSTDLSNINSNNGWEVLKNRQGQPIDLFGTVVSAPSNPTSVSNSNVRVVSTGYNANIAGDYGTAWKVYKYNNSTSYSLIQDTTNDRYAAPPSIFLLRGTSSGYDNAVANMNYPAASHSVDGVGNYTDDINKYVGIYKAAKAYANKPVYITYEKDAQDTRDNSSGTGAYRLDGRWYYTHASDYVQSTTDIEYWNSATGKWVKDGISAAGVGTTTGCTAKFSNNSRTSSSVAISSNSTWSFSATEAGSWLFDGWYIKYSDTSYDKIEGAGKSASIKATANYNLVARFVPTVAGALTITHKLTGASTGEGTVGLKAVVGSTTYNGTVDDNGTARVYIDSGLSNSNSSTTITVTLTTTPQYDGKVSAFGYDKFNTDKSITPTIKDVASGSTTVLPGNENKAITSTFSFTVGDLFAGATFVTDSLAYTSTITETPHNYNFKYNFTDRAGTSRSYTAKGVIPLKEYKEYITNQSSHTLDQSYLLAKAPFESNFLKTNTLTKGSISYTSSTHTFGATSSFGQTNYTPKQRVVVKLPYNYQTSSGTASGVAYKKYTATSYNSSKAAFDLAANYNEFLTNGATATTPGAQTNVSKVPSSDVNHTGNDFLTAPSTLMNGNTKMYFNYWKVSKLKNDGTAGNLVTKIYYPDFNYRVYSDYYLEAVFSSTAADSWEMKYTDSGETGCSVIYLGDSRNQWNNGSAANSTSTDSDATASDKIYNDFIFKYSHNNQELKGSSDVQIGMIIERVPKNDLSGYATGSSSVNDMSEYAALYSGTVDSRKSSITTKLNSNASLPKGCVRVDWNTSDLNDKNFMEQHYSVFSQYGQKVDADGTISYKNDNDIDNYVYRVYAFIKADGEYTLSDPDYFCMRYTSNLNYSE